MTARIGLDMNLLVATFGSYEQWCGLSASSVGATIGCPARLALPQCRTTSEAADRGTALHAFARIVGKNPAARAQALLDIADDYRATAEGMDIAAALADIEPIGFELAYALDVKKRSVRYIGENIERDYNAALIAKGLPPLGRYEVPFTMDVVGHIRSGACKGVPVELDWKSGQYLGDPSEQWQRKICASGLIFLYDVPEAISRLGYIWQDGSIHPDGCPFTMLDAEDFCDTVVKAIDAVWEARLLFANGIMPTVNPSDDNCKYCNAIASCPHYTNFAKAMLGKLQAIENGPELGALSPSELIKVWDELKQAEKIVEHQLKALKALRANGVQIEDEQYEVAAKTKSRGFFDAAKARGLLITLLGRQGMSEEQITAELAKLNGKTEYPEYRKAKRRLPTVAS